MTWKNYVPPNSKCQEHHPGLLGNPGIPMDLHLSDTIIGWGGYCRPKLMTGFFFFFFLFWLDKEKRRKWIDVEPKGCTLPNSWETIRIRTFFLVRQLWQAGFEGFKLMVQNERTKNSGTIPGRLFLGASFGMSFFLWVVFLFKAYFSNQKEGNGEKGG